MNAAFGIWITVASTLDWTDGNERRHSAIDVTVGGVALFFRGETAIQLTLWVIVDKTNAATTIAVVVIAAIAHQLTLQELSFVFFQPA